MSLQIVILAAGQGKRMYSSLPKVLHQLGEKTMLEHVVNTAQQLNPEAIHVIYGHGGEQIKDFLPGLGVNWVRQAEQLGTGHAVMQALDQIPACSEVLVLSADVPLIQSDTLQALIDKHHKEAASLALLVGVLENPTGLGRVVRDQNGNILMIAEEKDATPEQLQVREIYSGICYAPALNLRRWIPQLNNDNAQGEYYLTEIIAVAVKEQSSIVSICATDLIEIQGVNNRLQLQQLERVWQQRSAEKLMLAGVRIVDMNRFDLRGQLDCDQDVFLDVNVVISGRVKLGKGTKVGPNCLLTNVTTGEYCEIFANSVLEGVKLGDHCHIGPFARLRPQTQLADHCKVGNFVELKNATIAENSKASHLSYLGDVLIGKEVNIGAGTITCNYDGANKYQTIIEDGAFVGSDTQLVAPVTVGENATIGAGSTIRKNVPANELSLSLNPQKTIFGWKRPVKKS